MLSATAALRALALGDGTASQLLEAHVARIAQHNPRIRALVTLDIERARAAAQAVDALPLAERARRLAGEQPLLGLPISIKDAFATQGLRTTSSHPPLANYLPAADATLVARLKAAGAIVLGKSNLSELAGDPQCWSPLFGPTHNPWDLSLTPGGSSGGSAAAIAMGFAALELGSDIGGSIRIPAACCGVVGFKASENRLPRTGHIPHLPGQPRSVRHMLSFGLLARTVADVAHAMPSLAGADGEDQEVPPLPWRPQPPLTRPLRLAWCDDFAGLPLCPRTRAGLTQALAGARAAGHQLLRRQPAGPPLAQVWRAFGVLAGSEIGLALPARQRWPLALLAGLLPASQPATAPWRPAGAAEYRRAARALSGSHAKPDQPVFVVGQPGAEPAGGGIGWCAGGRAIGGAQMARRSPAGDGRVTGQRLAGDANAAGGAGGRLRRSAPAHHDATRGRADNADGDCIGPLPACERLDCVYL